VGQAGLSPENYRRVQSACVQAAALFGGVVVERGRHPWHLDPPGGPTEAREPGSETPLGRNMGSAQHGIRTPPRGSTVGQPPSPSDSPTSQRGTRHENPSERIARSRGNRLQSFLGCWGRKEETVLLEVASPTRGNRHDRRGVRRQTGNSRTGRG